MGRKDTVTGAYVKQNTIFADAFNYYIFDGQQVIRPDQLRELDTAEIVVPYGADGAGEPEQKYRDVMKSLTAMQDENAAYLLLGIENQSDVHYAMPVKNLVYDAIHYAKQVQEAANSHRKAKDYKEHPGTSVLAPLRHLHHRELQFPQYPALLAALAGSPAVHQRYSS